jgi:hypothetical protein
MLLASTQPRAAPPRPPISLQLASTLPEELLPEWSALALRPIVAQAKRLLPSVSAAATNSVPVMHVVQQRGCL